MITISAFADEISPNLKEQMDVCEQHGIKCIDVRSIDDINVSKMTIDQVKEYKKQMSDRGFKVPCLGSPIGKIKIGDDMNAHLDLLKHCCDVAKAFGTSWIRMFSFYPTDGAKISDQRDQAIKGIEAMVKVADQQDVVLYHENEAAIYGATTEGVKDIFASIPSPRLKGVFDPGNFVTENIKAFDEAWTVGLAEMTHYFHVKDKKYGAKRCVPAGEGDGQFAQIFADMKKRNWSGYMTLEPHLAGAGQFKGFTGPELFAEAVGALKKMLTEAQLEF